VVEDTAEGVVVAEVQDVVEPRVTTVSLAVEDTVVSADDRPVTGVGVPSTMVVVTPAPAVIITGGKRRARPSTKTCHMRRQLQNDHTLFAFVVCVPCMQAGQRTGLESAPLIS
jgi:hypothetical protein